MSRHPIFHSESSNVMTSTPVHLMSRTPPPQNNCNCRGVYAAAIDPLPLQLHLPRSTWQTSSNRITAPPQLIKKATMEINKRTVILGENPQTIYFEKLWISNPIFIKIGGAFIPPIRVKSLSLSIILFKPLSLSLSHLYFSNKLFRLVTQHFVDFILPDLPLYFQIFVLGERSITLAFYRTRTPFTINPLLVLFIMLLPLTL